MKPWKRIEPTTVTKAGWRTITTKTFVMSDGNEVAFDTVHADGQTFACIIALTPNNQVIVARQFRPGPEKVMDELPGGFVDAGETPEMSARRELLEETGYQAGEITYLGAIHKDTFMNATWHGFLARDCMKQTDQQKLEYEEHVEIDLISIEQLIDNAKNDRMTDHAVVLMAYDELRQINGRH